MTTVSELITELNKFDQAASVNGADSLTVSVTTNAPVIVATPIETPTDTPA